MKKWFMAFVLVLTCSTLALANERKEIIIFNWSEYIPQAVLDQFTKETGIRVIYTTYESNEAMYAKLKLLDGKGYDIVVPSSYFVDLMQKDGLLAPIDKEKLPNLKDVDPFIMANSLTEDDTYSVPYMWGAQGFMVNKKAVDPAEITSWNDLLRPEFHGKLLLSDDLRDSFGAALKATGASINSTNTEEIQKAYLWLRELSKGVRIFDVTAAKQALISEEVMAGLIWNGDAYIANAENPDLTFIYPKEGVPLWVDSFAIPSGAKNIDNAHIFINFMLRPDIAAICVEEYNYTSASLETKELLDKELVDSNLLFPTEDNLRNSEFTKSLGEVQKIYEGYWEDLKIAQ